MTFEYNKDIYSKTALIKAAYHFTDKAYLHLDSDGEKYEYRKSGRKNWILIEKLKRGLLVNTIFSLET